MSLKEYKYESKMKLELDGGTDGDKQITKSKTYGNIKPDTDNEKFYQVANSISGLQSLPLLKVKRIEEIELEEE